MAQEIKLHRDHPQSMAERIQKRLRNSGGEEADTITKTGDGARAQHAHRRCEHEHTQQR